MISQRERTTIRTDRSPFRTVEVPPKTVADIMGPKAWAGRRAFVIGGGPSLRGFDFGRLKGDLVIGVNRAFEVFDPAITFTMDARFIGWVLRGKLGDDSQAAYEASKCTKVIWRHKPIYDHGEWVWLGCVKTDDLVLDVKQGIPKINNSGLGAMLLAASLGASPIYLLGFDMKGNPETKKQAWFHDGYPTMQDDSVYRNGFLPTFERFAKPLEAAGVTVINLNPDSAMTCFEFGDFDLLESAPDHPLVVGYYTRETGYEAMAHEMAKSAHRFGFDCALESIENSRSWQKNTQAKASVLAALVERHKGKCLVYTDADSEFRSYPALFDSLDCDLGVHWRQGKELLSGTLFLRCNERTLETMRAWVDVCAENPNVWDQRCLQTAIEKTPRTMLGLLPPEYCHIFDSNDPTNGPPVVVHYQASRKLKKEIGR